MSCTHCSFQHHQLSALTISQPQDDFRGTIEAGDKVRRDVVLSREHGATKVSQLDDCATGAH